MGKVDHVIGVLGKNAIWSFGGTSVYLGVQWLIFAMLTKAASASFVGDYALVLAITAPVLMLTNLQLRAVLFSDPERSTSWPTYLTLRLITVSAYAAISGVVVAVSVHGRASLIMAIMIILSRGIDAIADVFLGLLQGAENMRAVGQYWLVNGCLGISLMAASIRFTHSVMFGLAGLVLASTAAALYATHAVRRHDLAGARPSLAAPPHRNRGVTTKRLSALVLTALPLGGAMMLTSLVPNIPRYFVSNYLGREALAGYTATVYFTMIGTAIVNATGEAIAPRLATHYQATESDQFRRLMRVLVATAIACGVVGLSIAAIFGKAALRLIYTEDYEQYYDLLIVVMATSVLTYLISSMGFTLTAARQYRIQPPLLAVTCAAIAAACAVLVRIYGLLGAAYGVGLGSFVGVLVWGWAVRHLSDGAWRRRWRR